MDNIERCGYEIRRIDCKTAKEYIRKNHYSHGCHNGPSPCYGLFENGELIKIGDIPEYIDNLLKEFERKENTTYDN